MGKMTDLVKERFEAIALEAVLRGLDPSKPMRESGIEWVGKIPKHWEKKRLKYTGLVKLFPIIDPDPVPWEQQSREPSERSIVVMKRGLAASTNLTIAQPKSLILVELAEGNHPEYWRSYINSHFAQSWLKRELPESSSSLTVESLRNLPVFVPPMAEQIEIAEFLVKEEDKLKNFIKLF